jgi:Na+/phosphate symporter
MHLERIGDNIELLVRAVRTMVREGILFTDREMSEVNALFEQAIGLVECVRDVIRRNNRVLGTRKWPTSTPCSISSGC